MAVAITVAAIHQGRQPSNYSWLERLEAIGAPLVKCGPDERAGELAQP